MCSIEQQQEIAVKVLKRCMDISTNTKADVFFDYSPHISGISISTHKNGWKNNHSSDNALNIYFDWPEEEIEAQIAEVEKCLSELEK